ncbi:MAG: 3-hydroxyacyl-[acyl-carrier-protein] dehydratase, FabZ form, partial [uncultured Thermoleophilia bacterium]
GGADGPARPGGHRGDHPAPPAVPPRGRDRRARPGRLRARSLDDHRRGAVARGPLPRQPDRARGPDDRVGRPGGGRGRPHAPRPARQVRRVRSRRRGALHAHRAAGRHARRAGRGRPARRSARPRACGRDRGRRADRARRADVRPARRGARV